MFDESSENSTTVFNKDGFWELIVSTLFYKDALETKTIQVFSGVSRIITAKPSIKRKSITSAISLKSSTVPLIMNSTLGKILGIIAERSEFYWLIVMTSYTSRLGSWQ